MHRTDHVKADLKSRRTPSGRAVRGTLLTIIASGWPTDDVRVGLIGGRVISALA